MTVVDLEPWRVDDAAAKAEVLGSRVMAASADVARQDAVFLTLLGEFDATEAYRFWDGLQSTAHWLGWACSIAPVTAREHVRVARALRRMPATAAAFGAGELTYSKVRELTRLVDEIPGLEADSAEPSADDSVGAAGGEQVRELANAGAESPVDVGSFARTDPFVAEEELSEVRVVRFARATTASQLARSVSGYRRAAGTSRQRRARQRVSWWRDEDGCVHLSAVLPPEEGAAVIGAIQAAMDAQRIPDPETGQECADEREPGQSDSELRQAAQNRTRVEALCEVAGHYLASSPEDRSGEDRTMVVLEISASALTADREADGPTSPNDADPAASSDQAGRVAGVPAGTAWQKCRVRGGAAIEASTALRAMCDAPILGVLVDDVGEPLTVGRTQRFVTRAQRRALMVRDGCCQFPGCGRTRHLKAHHRIHWSAGGPTDLANLIMLCQWHHTRVHEDRIAISTCEHPGCGTRWRFTRPDGTAIVPIIAGRDERNPWQPLSDTEGRPLTGPAREAAIRRNDEQVTGYRTRQAALRDQAERAHARYAHIHDTDHPDARRAFPVGGGEGFSLAECVDALFRMTGHRAA